MSRLVGVKRARKRASGRNDALDRHVVSAISGTVDVVHVIGRSNIDAMVKRRSGLLRRRYSKTVRKAQMLGIVGYITPAARRSAFYARFVHDGTRYITARPFHDLAVAEAAISHSRRMRKALSSAISTSGSPSSLARNGRGKVGGI
ncbi:MAG: hypothetical protein ABJL99_10130 [Aliishimia sp.]